MSPHRDQSDSAFCFHSCPNIGFQQAENTECSLGGRCRYSSPENRGYTREGSDLGEICGTIIVNRVNVFDEACLYGDEDPFCFPGAMSLVNYASAAIGIGSVKREFSPVKSLEELFRWIPVARTEFELFFSYVIEERGELCDHLIRMWEVNGYTEAVLR